MQLHWPQRLPTHLEVAAATPAKDEPYVTQEEVEGYVAKKLAKDLLGILVVLPC